MKKVLLSMAALLLCGGYSYAADVELNAGDATDIQGTEVAEVPAEGNNNGQAKHVQPLESLKINGYTFTFATGSGSTDPAYYWPMSTKPDGNKTIRVYKSNTMKMAAPAGSTFKTLKGYEGNTETVIYSGDAVSEYEWTNTTGANKKFTKFVVSDEGGVTPPPAEGTHFAKATTLDNGVYVFTCNGQLAKPEAQDKSYGRMSLVDVTMENGEVVTTEDNAFTITVNNGQATIVDTYGRYYSMDATHLTTFQLYTTANEYSYWTYAFEGDNVKFTNATNTDCFISQSKGNQGTWYTNVAPAKNPTEYNLPVLYKKVSSGVAGVEVSEDAPAVYYNLQGVRVANPENGLYIVVKGGKSQKVLVR